MLIIKYVRYFIFWTPCVTMCEDFITFGLHTNNCLITLNGDFALSKILQGVRLSLKKEVDAK